MKNRRLAGWVSAVAAVGLATGGVAAAWPANASASVGMPVINGHRCTKVTRRAHVTLQGTRGKDVLCGLGGYDTLIGGTGNDILIGRGGHDTASFHDHVSGLIASLATGLETDPTAHQTDHLIGISNLIGGRAGNDVLVGNSGNNRLVAGGGNDLLEGRSGNDTLVGGSGRDWLIGGRGHDHIWGGSGRDVIDASDGSDDVDCGAGTDVVNTDSSTNESDCGGDQNESLQRYRGTVSAVDTTQNTISVQWTDVSDTAQAWLDSQTPPDPNPVTISLNGANIDFGGGHEGDGDGNDGGDGGDGGQGDNARPADTTGATGPTGGGTIQVGDLVEVEATTSPDGTSLVALDVHVEPNLQNLQNYEGTVTSVDTTMNTISVTYTDVNDDAQAWLDAHGDPQPVTISLNGADVERDGGPPVQVGDGVEVEATTDSSGANLVALDVHAEAPDNGGD